MKFLLRSTSFAALALAASACSTSPPEAIKAGDVPAAFTAPQAQNAAVWPQGAWWTQFASPEMAGFVTTAQSENLDLAAAAARVLQAQAQTGVAASALFPAVDLNASAQRRGSNVATVPPTPKAYNTFGASLQASYQLDFWGLAQDNLRAARYSARSAIYAREVVFLTATADTANTYMDVLALRQRITIAKQNIEAAKRILTITEAKVTNGVSSNLDLAQQKAQLASQEGQIPALEEQEREARYALAILLGRAPEGFDVTAQNLDGIVAPPVVPGLPAQLLLRRPDVAEAEANLISAHANVDAARAAFLPAIGLTGSGGYASTAVNTLFNPTSLAWSVGASLLQTIFDGGRLSSQNDVAKGREAELVADYRKAVFSALSDVETSLGQVSSLADQERLKSEEVDNAAEAFRISELQYREGVADLLAVLQTQQTLFTAQDQLVQLKLARLQAGVSLYQALGGGWTVDAEADTPTRNGFMPLPMPNL
jgi:NodT family efflux transporter outer membrane factor (OMF) lipoprotein